jgi:hypothetical protein
MKNVLIRKPTEVETRTIAGITFTTAEIAEINNDLDQLAKEQAELEWFELIHNENV